MGVSQDPRRDGRTGRQSRSVERGHQPAAGLRRPVWRAAAAVARPDKGRQLRRGDPHPRIHPPADHRTAAQDAGPVRAPARPPPRPRRTRPAGPVPLPRPQPARHPGDQLPHLPEPVPPVGRPARPGRQLRRPPGPPHPGHPAAGPRRRAAPHPPLPRPRLDPHDRALREGRHQRDRGHPAAHLGRRTRRPEPRRTAVRPLLADGSAAGRGHDDRPEPGQHPHRGRVLHLPARRERRHLPVEPGLPLV